MRCYVTLWNLISQICAQFTTNFHFYRHDEPILCEIQQNLKQSYDMCAIIKYYGNDFI